MISDRREVIDTEGVCDCLCQVTIASRGGLSVRCYNRVQNQCGCGETGRRARFRFWFPQGSGGSSPLIRTNVFNCLQRFLSAFVNFAKGLLKPVRSPTAVASGAARAQARRTRELLCHLPGCERNRWKFTTTVRVADRSALRGSHYSAASRLSPSVAAANVSRKRSRSSAASTTAVRFARVLAAR